MTNNCYKDLSINMRYLGISHTKVIGFTKVKKVFSCKKLISSHLKLLLLLLLPYLLRTTSKYHVPEVYIRAIHVKLLLLLS